MYSGLADAAKADALFSKLVTPNLPGVTSLGYRGEADDDGTRYLSMIGASQQLHHRRKQRTRLLRRVQYPYPLRESNSRCQIESLVS